MSGPFSVAMFDYRRVPPIAGWFRIEDPMKVDDLGVYFRKTIFFSVHSRLAGSVKKLCVCHRHDWLRITRSHFGPQVMLCPIFPGTMKSEAVSITHTFNLIQIVHKNPQVGDRELPFSLYQ